MAVTQNQINSENVEVNEQNNRIATSHSPEGFSTDDHDSTESKNPFKFFRFNFPAFKVRFKKRIFPVLLFGLGLGLVTLIGIAAYLYVKESNVEIRDVNITNISNGSATVTWVSNKKTKGVVYYGEENKWFPVFAFIGKQREDDDRDVRFDKKGNEVLLAGGRKEYYTHHATIEGLEPNTRYYFRIGTGVIRGFSSDSDGNGFTAIETGPVIESLKSPDPAYGRVYRPDGSPLSDALVYLYLERDGILKTTTISTYTSESGTWSIDLGNARTLDQTGSVQIEEDDKEYIFVQGAINGTKEISVPTDRDQPTPDIVLTEIDSHFKAQNELPEIVFRAYAVGNNCCSDDICSNYGGDWVAGYNACASGGCSKCQVSARCGNKICESGENHGNCPSDCNQHGEDLTSTNSGGTTGGQTPLPQEGSGEPVATTTNTDWNCGISENRCLTAYCRSGLTPRWDATGCGQGLGNCECYEGGSPQPAPIATNTGSGSGIGMCVCKSKANGNEVKRASCVSAQKCCSGDSTSSCICDSNSNSEFIPAGPGQCGNSGGGGSGGTGNGGGSCNNNGVCEPLLGESNESCANDCSVSEQSIVPALCSAGAECKGPKVNCEWCFVVDNSTGAKTPKQWCKSGVFDSDNFCCPSGKQENGRCAYEGSSTNDPFNDCPEEGRKCNNCTNSLICFLSGKQVNWCQSGTIDGDNTCCKTKKITAGKCDDSNDLVAVGSGSDILGATEESYTINVDESGKYLLLSDQFEGGKREVEVFVPEGGQGKIIFFYDLNNNSIKDDDEEYVKGDLQIQIEFKESAVIFNLLEGWNLIGMPLFPREGTGRTAKEFLTAINGTGGFVTHVATYREGQFLIFSRRGDNDFGSDFNILPGEAYFIRSYRKHNHVVNGNRFSEMVPVQTTNGWNLVSVIKPGSSFTAESVLDSMISQGINADAFSQYESGLYTSIIKENGELFGRDFGVVETRGYFVRVRDGGGKTWKP
ncbi:fibronectin type III domain-containing protein [Candidatus Dojkabacteria bacterium]|nr:fibronectin type III domain-containing protein [Candidatus Dojkabacteria bacterium]